MPLDALPWSLYGTMMQQIPGLPDALAAAQEQAQAGTALSADYEKRQAAAQQAFQQLQAASLQPPPAAPVSSPTQFFGDVASIISRNPVFGQRAAQGEAQKRAEMLQLRADNLQALRDNYNKMAQAAGEDNPVLKLQYLEKVKAQDAALERIQENIKNNQTLASLEANRQNQRDIANILAQARIKAAQSAADARKAGGGVMKPPTARERLVLNYYLRADEALKNIGTPINGGPTLEEKIASQNYLKKAQGQYAPNILQSPDQQLYRQAQRAFTEARLRKESGATIRPDEYQADAKTYFFQPGDSPQTLAQKQKARERILLGTKLEAGNAYKEYYQGQQSQADDSQVQAILDAIENATVKSGGQ